MLSRSGLQGHTELSSIHIITDGGVLSVIISSVQKQPSRKPPAGGPISQYPPRCTHLQSGVPATSVDGTDRQRSSLGMGSHTPTGYMTRKNTYVCVCVSHFDCDN